PAKDGWSDETGRQQKTDGQTKQVGGQNWTPVTPPEGSIFHAETHREAIDLNISLDIIALDVLDWNDKVVATIPIEDALNGYPMKH
ncbi:hypothetical protein, partial [Rhizobium sp. Leaf453]|uniref:hypothetical protein n=1 Tax=Rhizobium sp. Leaf453 TaxID=1736380 RepID=UPI0007156F82